MSQAIAQALASYFHRRTQCQQNAVDACADAAEFFGVPVATLAQAILATGRVGQFDAARLSLI